MKRISTLKLWLCFLILFTGLAVFSKSKGKTVLDYVSSVKHPTINRVLSNGYDYEIPIKNIVNQSEEKAEFKISTDKKFLQVTTSGGTGPEIRQFALLNLPGLEVFALNREYGGHMFDKNFIVLLVKRKGRWKDETKQLMPTLKIEDFAEKPELIDSKKNLRHFAHIAYELSEGSSDILARSDINWYEWIVTKHSGPEIHEQTSRAAYELLKPLNYEYLRLTWNPKAKKYAIVDRILRIEKLDIQHP